jgi:hypothetical protein
VLLPLLLNELLLGRLPLLNEPLLRLERLSDDDGRCMVVARSLLLLPLWPKERPLLPLLLGRLPVLGRRSSPR